MPPLNSFLVSSASSSCSLPHCSCSASSQPNSRPNPFSKPKRSNFVSHIYVILLGINTGCRLQHTSWYHTPSHSYWITDSRWSTLSPPFSHLTFSGISAQCLSNSVFYLRNLPHQPLLIRSGLGMRHNDNHIWG